MPLRTETRVLAGDPPIEITFTQLPAMRALDLFLVLGKVIGPALLQANELDMEKDVSELAPILEGLFTRLGTGDGKLIVREVLGSAAVKFEGRSPVVLNTQETIDMVFGGRLESNTLWRRYCYFRLLAPLRIAHNSTLSRRLLYIRKCSEMPPVYCPKSRSSRTYPP